MKLAATTFAQILTFAASTFQAPEAQAVQNEFTKAYNEASYNVNPTAVLAAAGYSVSAYPSVGIWMQIETPTHMLTVFNEKHTTSEVGFQGDNMLARLYTK